jgi:hypothetical protein
MIICQYIRIHLIFEHINSFDNPRNIFYEFFHLRYLLRVLSIDQKRMLLQHRIQSSIDYNLNYEKKTKRE